jgi:multiple antibiotic resistance protein
MSPPGWNPSIARHGPSVGILRGCAGGQRGDILPGTREHGRGRPPSRERAAGWEATLELTAFIALSFTSLLAMIDPLGCIPFFSGLTSRMEERQKRRVLAKALLVALLVLAGFTLVGAWLLDLFGITVDAFRIAGGVIFFGIGLDMLQSRPRRWRTGIRGSDPGDPEPLPEEDPSITPLAIPLLAGPGSITTVIVLMAESPVTWGAPLVLGALLVVIALTGAVLIGADLVLRRLGDTGLRLMEKLMGLLVTVIAVQLVLNGTGNFIRELGGGG